MKPGTAPFIRRSVDGRIYETMNKAIDIIDTLIIAEFSEFRSNFDSPASAGEALRNGLFSYIDGTVWMSAGQARSDHRKEWIKYKGGWVRDGEHDESKFVQRALDYHDRALAVMAGESDSDQ